MNKIFTGIAACCLMMLFSCESKNKLANDIQGTWSGTPELLKGSNDQMLTIVDSYNFTKNDNSDGGVLIINSMVSATGSIQPDSDIIQPYQISEAAVATAEGTWEAIDDDEIAITIDPQKIKISIDPSAIVFTENEFTEEENPMFSDLKPAIAQKLENRLKSILVPRYSSINHLDDVKVKNNIMRYEIGEQKFTMSKQVSGM